MRRPTVTRYTAVLPTLVCLICTAATLWLASLTFASLPKYDEWQVFVPALTGEEPLNAAWLWIPLNEHRVPLPRLAYLMGVGWSGDFRAGAFMNVLILAAVAAGGIRTASLQRGGVRVRDAFFPLILLHWGQTHLFLLSVTLNFTIPIALAYGAMLAAVRADSARAHRMARFVALSVLGMVLSSLIGVLMALPWLVWLLVRVWVSLREDLEARRAARWLTVAVLLSCAVISLCVWGFARPPETAPPPALTLADRATSFLVLLALSLGWLGRLIGPAAGALVGVLGLAIGARLVRATWKDPRDPARTGLLALLVGAGLVLVSIGAGRSVFVGEALWATTRYAALSIPILVVAYEVAFGLGRPGIWLQRTLAVVALMVFVGPLIPAVRYPYAQEFLRIVAGQERELIRDLRAGEDSEVAARKFFPHQNGYDPRDGARWIDMLRRKGMGPFSDEAG